MIKLDICNNQIFSQLPKGKKLAPEYTILDKVCRPQNIVNLFSKTIEQNNKPNQINVNFSGSGTYIAYRDLVTKIRLKAKEVISDFNNDEIREFTNMSIRNLWTLNTGSVGWNWTLRDYEIILDGNSARYKLPMDFYGLSGVSFTDTKNGKKPSEGYFSVVEANQWDSVQFGNYIMYRFEDDSFYLYVRTKNMNGWCSDGLNLRGSIFVKYYCSPPKIENIETKIYGLPRQWGVEDILVDLIAREMFSAKGKIYPQSAGLETQLSKLMKLDRGQPLKDNLYKSQPMKFKVIRD